MLIRGYNYYVYVIYFYTGRLNILVCNVYWCMICNF